MADRTDGQARLPEQVRRLLDAKAPAWSAKYGPDRRLSGRLTELITALHGQPPPGGRLLDLGCGTGELARAAAAAGRRVTACDIAAQMLRLAAERDPGSAVEWVRLDPGWRTLPFGTAVFDTVVAASVLGAVDDPATVLGECARVLRPGRRRAVHGSGCRGARFAGVSGRSVSRHACRWPARQPAAGRVWTVT